MIVEVKLLHKSKPYRVSVRSHTVASAGAVVLNSLPKYWSRKHVTIINCIGYCHCMPLSYVTAQQFHEHKTNTPRI